MSDWHEDSLRHKYDPLPDEPRHRKKAKKRHVRSDHKHEYELVCIDAHTEVITHKGRIPYYYIGMRCKVCGRLQNVRSRTDVNTPPAGMKTYEVEDFFELWKMKILPDEMVVGVDTQGSTGPEGSLFSDDG